MVALGLMAKLLAAWQPWCVGVKLTEYNITPMPRSRKKTSGRRRDNRKSRSRPTTKALVSFQNSPFVK